MLPSGYYKTNYRRLRFRELLRMYGWGKGITNYWHTRFMPPGGGTWMPGLWAEMECNREDLSEQFWQATAPHHLKFEQLGFSVCGFKKMPMSLIPLVQESGGINYLDATGHQFGQLLCHRLKQADGTEVNHIIIAFTSVFESDNLVCTNHKRLFDPLEENEVIRLDSCDVGFIHQQFLAHFQKRSAIPRRFSNVDALRCWFDERQVKTFEARVRRKLFVPMTNQEVASALRPLLNPTTSHPDAIQNHDRWAGVKWAALLAVIVTVFFCKPSRHLHHGLTDTLEYRGQQFKMAKAYATYEDFKDDPNNLNTNELDRIEQEMIRAAVPSTFKSRDELFHFLVFDLQFPGYGLGSESVQTDDGSKIIVESVEIPQRDKDRYLVVCEVAGQPLKLLDDFVSSTSTNLISHIKLERQTLHYFNRDNQLVREKHL